MADEAQPGGLSVGTRRNDAPGGGKAGKGLAAEKVSGRRLRDETTRISIAALAGKGDSP
jgi:hypothetical protein